MIEASAFLFAVLSLYRTNGTFSVVTMQPVSAEELSGKVGTALPTGVATMEKHFAGAIEGRSEIWLDYTLG